MAMLRTKIPGSSLVLLALVALSGCVNDSVDTPQGAMPAADGRLIRFTAGSSELLADFGPLTITGFVCFIAFNWRRRHSRRFLAPTPTGSNSCIT